MAETLEDGDLYLLYRPRVEEQQVESLDDVQRLLVVLHPWSGRRLLRLLVIGRKQLPEIEERERFWGFVDTVVERPEQLREALDGRTYGTRTRGERHQPAAQPVAEGAYVIARHDDHSHLAYQLELPRRFGEAQQELNIEPEASYVVSVKNPQAPSPRGVGLPESEKGQLPSELQERFRNRRFVSLDPPDFLDHPGTELLLIGAAHDASEELRLNLDVEVERAARSTIFDDLVLGREERPVEPLFEGRWR
ncbi:hypothetical protein [Micromonospora sp. NPDC049679]|uniref:hypothetical protein n=1 Tax=Micromonospora sp. NPDC049679 TaxID=3155920 RepID=UPI0033C05836